MNAQTNYLKNVEQKSSSPPISFNSVQRSIESQGAWGKVSKCRWKRQELDIMQLCDVPQVR